MGKKETFLIVIFNLWKRKTPVDPLVKQIENWHGHFKHSEFSQIVHNLGYDSEQNAPSLDYIYKTKFGELDQDILFGAAINRKELREHAVNLAGQGVTPNHARNLIAYESQVAKAKKKGYYLFKAANRDCAVKLYDKSLDETFSLIIQQTTVTNYDVKVSGSISGNVILYFAAIRRKLITKFKPALDSMQKVKLVQVGDHIYTEDNKPLLQITYTDSTNVIYKFLEEQLTLAEFFAASDFILGRVIPTKKGGK